MAIKKRLISLVLICCFLLSGCSIGGEVYEKIPHLSEEQPGYIPADMVVVSTYSAIKSKLHEMINSAETSVKFAVVDYWGDIESDIKDIIVQITTEDPVGSYAVSSIIYEQAKTIDYHQVSLSIQYKKTALEIKNIINIKNRDEFEAQLGETFKSFKTKQVFNVSVTHSASELVDMAHKAYYNSPATAIGLKSVKFSPIKDTKMNQILELDIEYLWDKADMMRARDIIKKHGEEIVSEWHDNTTDEKIQFIYDYLQMIPIDEESMIVVSETNNAQPKSEPYSAYGALVTGKTSQSGIALSAKLFCDILEVPSYIIEGTKNDIPHLWLIVDRGDIWQHFDVTNTEGNYIISSMDLAQNYTFDQEIYPVD
ncbi:MAG: hypothetical protein E7432_02385 [Ruminococcaceae bacterium]|nr:hypothetical protein [Oscillospiraceae bacterium]